jgi:hypothetical protein
MPKTHFFLIPIFQQHHTRLILSHNIINQPKP